MCSAFQYSQRECAASPPWCSAPEAIAMSLPSVLEFAGGVGPIPSDIPSSPLSSLTPSLELTSAPSYSHPGTQPYSPSNTVPPSGRGKGISKKHYNAGLGRRDRQPKRVNMDALAYKPSKHTAETHGDPPAVETAASVGRFTRVDSAWMVHGRLRTLAGIPEL